MLKSETTMSMAGTTIITIAITPIVIFFVSLSAFLMPIEAITFSDSVFGASSSGTNIVTSAPVAVGTSNS
ncbi:hypothetical protein NP493_272g00006 [Ridgeia piscesae]|uniref:Uncharacterized protein n=1 Tax=Ridgeia piscesae TaxID=27915 RepID=A0AAD9NXG5_RIDPI|nr:hypothetical protein NP493_272g00006 [Ridgeia piscesae]